MENDERVNALIAEIQAELARQTKRLAEQDQRISVLEAATARLEQELAGLYALVFGTPKIDQPIVRANPSQRKGNISRSH